MVEGAEVPAGKPGKKPVKKKLAPKFIKTPSKQIELLQGQNVELVCKVVANPPAKLEWLKNQKVVSRLSSAFLVMIKEKQFDFR